MKKPLIRKVSYSAGSGHDEEERTTYPSGLARISSVIELRIALLLFLKAGRYGFDTSK
jgi:hypothetical protein